MDELFEQGINVSELSAVDWFPDNATFATLVLRVPNEEIASKIMLMVNSGMLEGVVGAAPGSAVAPTTAPASPQKITAVVAAVASAGTLVVVGVLVTLKLKLKTRRREIYSEEAAMNQVSLDTIQ